MPTTQDEAMARLKDELRAARKIRDIEERGRAADDAVWEYILFTDSIEGPEAKDFYDDLGLARA